MSDPSGPTDDQVAAATAAFWVEWVRLAEQMGGTSNIPAFMAEHPEFVELARGAMRVALATVIQRYVI